MTFPKTLTNPYSSGTSAFVGGFGYNDPSSYNIGSSTGTSSNYRSYPSVFNSNTTLKDSIMESANEHFGIGNTIDWGNKDFLGKLSPEQIEFVNTNMANQPWYQNSSMLGNIANLGSAFAQLAALPSRIKFANAQTRALNQNIDTAREEQARRNSNISAFNSFVA